jgi:hypothetical protein
MSDRRSYLGERSIEVASGAPMTTADVHVTLNAGPFRDAG